MSDLINDIPDLVKVILVTYIILTILIILALPMRSKTDEQK